MNLKLQLKISTVIISLSLLTVNCWAGDEIYWVYGVVNTKVCAGVVNNNTSDWYVFDTLTIVGEGNERAIQLTGRGQCPAGATYTNLQVSKYTCKWDDNRLGWTNIRKNVHP